MRDQPAWTAIIGGADAQARAGNHGGGRRVLLLQPRGRAAGHGRPGGARRAPPARQLGAPAGGASALAGRNRPFDPGLAAAGRRASARPPGGGPAGAGGGIAGADDRRRAHAQRASRAARVPRDAGDRHRRGRIGLDRPRALDHPHRRPDPHAGAGRAGPAQPPSISAELRRTDAGLGDDDRRRPRLRLERCGHQTGLRQPRPASSARRGGLGPVDRRRFRASGRSAR